VARTAAEAVEHLIGLQAQVPVDPYVGLWSRLEGFDPAELSGLLVDGMVAALWRLTLDDGAAKLRIETFGRVSQVAAIEAEGDRLIDFLAPEATAREIELVPR
jgi:hypothetical protein